MMEPKSEPHHAASLYSLSALAALQSNIAQQFGAVHHSPALEFTGAPLSADAEAKLLDYRGEKVAGFEIDGDTMICLPQAYEHFLKNLVGGLHTVYTKLKRLDIVPRVCNVEQVRALRSLGAIQPGVNRCKLISCKDFDILYQDCTSSRPGRPPKRSPPFPSLSGDPSVFKKARGLEQDWKGGPLMGVGGPGGLFPFLPFSAHQFMLSQMGAAGAFGGGGGGGDASPHSPFSPQPYKNADSASPPPQDNEQKASAENNDNQRSEPGSEDGDTDGDWDSQGSPPPSSSGPPPQPPMPTFNPFLWNGWNNKPGVAPKPASSSVDSLLSNVLSLIELAASTVRKQEDCLVKEKNEAIQQLEVERGAKNTLVQQLQKEERLRKIYEKRWRKAKRGKIALHRQLLELAEKTGAPLNPPSSDPTPL